MIVPRIAPRCLLFCLLVSSLPQLADAHGGVVEEDDSCVIKVGYLRAHFKVYQPRLSGHEQYCEDLPAATESVFVMEYLHDSMSEMLIDFRIIRDVTGKGRFARIEDVNRIPDIESVSVYHHSAAIEPDIYLVNHDFTEEGDFIGIVSATQPGSGKVYEAVFPFEVGYTGFGYWPFFVILLVLVQLQFLLMGGKLKRWFVRAPVHAASLFLCLLLYSSPSIAEGLVISYTPLDGPTQINRMHSWILHVEDEDGIGVEGASITITGGMPDHDHGLPTNPRVTKELGGGDYQLDGLRFHMSGYWEIIVTVTTDYGTSTVIVPLQL